MCSTQLFVCFTGCLFVLSLCICNCLVVLFFAVQKYISSLIILQNCKHLLFVVVTGKVLVQLPRKVLHFRCDLVLFAVRICIGQYIGQRNSFLWCLRLFYLFFYSFRAFTCCVGFQAVLQSESLIVLGFFCALVCFCACSMPLDIRTSPGTS